MNTLLRAYSIGGLLNAGHSISVSALGMLSTSESQPGGGRNSYALGRELVSLPRSALYHAWFSNFTDYHQQGTRLYGLLLSWRET